LERKAKLLGRDCSVDLQGLNQLGIAMGGKDDREPLHLGQHLFQNLDPLGHDFRAEPREARHVRFRPREVGDQT